MGWPQIAVIVLIAFALGIGLAQHGKNKAGKHSVFKDMVANAILCGLLYAGGFWA